MYITVDGARVATGGWGREGGEGEQRGKLALVRCLVSVETGGVEKTNYLLLAKDENRMLERRRCCKCVIRTTTKKKLLFRRASSITTIHYVDVSLRHASRVFPHILHPVVICSSFAVLNGCSATGVEVIKNAQTWHVCPLRLRMCSRRPSNCLRDYLLI